MGHVLLWIETQAAALFLGAAVISLSATWRRPFWRTCIFISIAPLVLIVLDLIINVFWDFGPQDTEPYAILLSWMTCLLVGVIVLFWRASRTSHESVRAAVLWPRGRLLLCSLAAAILCGMTMSNIDVAMKMELARLQQEASTRLLGSLIQPHIPDQDNAAPIYKQAQRQMTRWDKLQAPWNERAKTWLTFKTEDPKGFDPREKDLRDFLATQQESLELWRRGSAKADCLFVENALSWSSDMPATLHTSLMPVFDGAKLLRLDALAKAANGDTQAAMADVAALFGMTRQSLSQPTLFTVLISTAIAETAARSLEEVARYGLPTMEDLASIPPAREKNRKDLVQQAIDFEVNIAWPLGPNQLAGDPGPPASWFELGVHLPILSRQSWLRFVWRVFFLEKDLADFRHQAEEMQKIATLSYKERVVRAEELQKSTRRRPWGGLTDVNGYYLIGTIQEMTASEARYDLARLAIATLSYKAKNGAYPDKLSDLTPQFISQIPLDPFDGQPLRMKREGTGLILYSVGWNLQDDGGTETTADRTGGDILFRLP